MSESEREAIFKFESPSSTVIAGPSMSGTTVLTLAVLRKAGLMYTIPPERILYAYGVHQKIFDDLEAEVTNLSTHHGLPTLEMIEELKSQDEEGHSLLVLDDLMDEIC